MKRRIDVVVAEPSGGSRRAPSRRGLLLLVACSCVAGLARPVRAEPVAADAVALLPLDAEKSLEIYGQPVASEIARALVAGSVAVVVVGPRTAVPERARLIIDGTISLGKASAVTISLRIRDPLDGKVLDTLSATAPGLAKIDSAAAELSARVLPIIRDKLAALRARPPDDRDHGRVTLAPPPAVDRAVLVAISDGTRAGRGAPLSSALDAAVSEWTRAHQRQLRKIDADKLVPKIAVRTVGAAQTELGIGFWIVDYQPEAGPVPMARARVRVRIADASAIVFDRVVATDTVLGDKGLAGPALAARVAREVLAILRPHMRRGVPSWE
ncbi:MAG TPA: hypothetical protein VFK02_10510 [Kofleriaceae bacterium]|nr:hypothetical protein [Kofleriaceae bacterium]